MKTIFICKLPKKAQEEIRKELSIIIPKIEIETAMNGRLCDLEEIIDIKKYV